MTSRTRSSACSSWAAAGRSSTARSSRAPRSSSEKGDFKADIPGIETDDKTGKITITLTEPDTKILFALAEPYSSPTPAAKSPAKSLKQPPPGVGPYVLDVKDFNRLYELTRNKNWTDIPGIPKGNFDKITGQVSDSVTKMTQDVITGKVDFMTEDPTGDQLPEVRAKYADRYSEEANPPNVYYNFLNVTVPPFDKQEAREAFNYAVDSNALVRVFGGRLTPGCNFLPPGVVGYKEAECKYGEPDGEPDLAKARELVKQSGYEGEKVTFWTNNKDPRPAIADYFRDVLNEIGFEADVKTLDQQVYFEQIGLKRTKAQTGFTDWYQDYPHPGDFVESLLSTRALSSEVDVQPGIRQRSGARQEARRAARSGSGGRGRRVGRAGQLHRQREGVCPALRVRGVELVLLGADGCQELRWRPPRVQERLAAVLHKGLRRSARAAHRVARAR